MSRAGEPVGIVVDDLGHGVLRWQLCNPARRNAVAPATLLWLAHAASQLSGEIVVLTGAGDESFCAGFDLSALEVSTDHEDAQSLPDAPLITATRAMLRADATFIAVINGYAIGAGVELACACDLRIARHDAWFEVPAGRLGVVYHSDGLARLRAAFGAALTRRLVVLGERVDARLAEAAGAFVRCVPADQLETQTRSVIAALRRSTPLALRGNRDLLRSLDVEPLDPRRRSMHERARLAAYRSEEHRQARRNVLGPSSRGPRPLVPRAPSPDTLFVMAIREEIDARLKQARRDRDDRTKNVIAMLKNKVLMELKSGSGRQEDDALWQEVLASYAKQLRKALPELEKAGERGVQAREETLFELDFCEGFLPKKLDEAQTEALVRKVAAEHGIEDNKQLGKLMGILMKEHRDAIDGQLARAVASRILAG